MWVTDDLGYLRLDSVPLFWIDDWGFVRLDAKAGNKNCTPGKTIPCGNRCRTPANCVKAKNESSQGRVQRLGKEELGKFADEKRKAKGLGDRETVNMVRGLEKEIFSDEKPRSPKTANQKPATREPVQRRTENEASIKSKPVQQQEDPPKAPKAKKPVTKSEEYQQSDLLSLASVADREPGEGELAALNRIRTAETKAVNAAKKRAKPLTAVDPVSPEDWKTLKTTNEDRQGLMDSLASGGTMSENWVTSRIKDCVDQAGNPPYPEEVMGIKLYTSEEFAAINGALRGVDDESLKKAAQRGLSPDRSVEQVRAESLRNAKVITSGLNALPDYKGTVFRGMKTSSMSPDDIKRHYQPGSVITEKGFTSTSSDVSASYGKRSGYNVQFVINSKTGKSIEKLAQYDFEREVLFRPSTKFKVLKQEDVDGKTVIYMDEV